MRAVLTNVMKALEICRFKMVLTPHQHITGAQNLHASLNKHLTFQLHARSKMYMAVNATRPIRAIVKAQRWEPLHPLHLVSVALHPSRVQVFLALSHPIKRLAMSEQ